METGNNHQNIENPLFLMPLFESGVFVLKSDFQQDALSEERGNVGRINPDQDLGNLAINKRVSSEEAPKLDAKSPQKQVMKIVNVFPDVADSEFADNSLLAYEKLMTNIKLDGEPLPFTKVAMLNLNNSLNLKSAVTPTGIHFSMEFLDEFTTTYCLLWSDQPMKFPSMQHYSMANFNNMKLIFLPGFSTMLSSTDLKKYVWVSLKQLLGFV